MARTAEQLVKAAKAEITEISVPQAKQLVGSNVVFVDVREPSEWQAGTIREALCIPRGVLEWRAADDEPLKDKTTPVVVYCKVVGARRWLPKRYNNLALATSNRSPVATKNRFPRPPSGITPDKFLTKKI